MKFNLLTTILFLCGLTAGHGQETTCDKVITNACMIGVGPCQSLDTYLSPEHYRGTALRFLSHTQRGRDSVQSYREIMHEGSIATLDNRSGNGGELAGHYRFQYGWQRHLLQRPLGNGFLTLNAGVHLDAHIGFLYNTRGSNNPAQAQLSLQAAPVGEATYRLSLGNRPVLFRYEVGIPVVGVMFSPAFGQSYYEIFTQGNYDHNVAPTWVGNAPSLWHMATVDLQLGKTSLRMGYWGDYRQSSVNQIKAHNYTHLFMVGIVRKFRIQTLRHP